MAVAAIPDETLPQGFFGRLLAAFVGRAGIWRSIAGDGLAWQPVFLGVGVAAVLSIPLAAAIAASGPEGKGDVVGGVSFHLALTLGWCALAAPVFALDVWAVWMVTRARDDRWGFWGWFGALAFASSPILLGAAIQNELAWLGAQIWCLCLWVAAGKELAGRSTGAAILRIVAGMAFGAVVTFAVMSGVLIALLGMAG